jgi:hypothetical protein
MAGRRHHTIPQLLQRGFASSRKGGETFVWQYRKGQSGFENNTKNVSVERDFYGEPDETDLDDRITDLEPKLADDVQELRAEATTAPKVVDSKMAARLVAHFALRTRQLRGGIEGTMHFTADFIHRDMQDLDFATATLAEAAQNAPWVRGIIQQILIEQGVPQELHEEIASAIEPQLPDFLAAAVKDPNSPYLTIMGNYFNAFHAMTKEGAKKGHNAALAANLHSPERVAFYESYQWFVVATETALILGDSVCVFETSGGRRFRPIDLEVGDAFVIFLPLAARVLLYGSLSPMQRIDTDLINRASAGCSDDFFISSQELPTDSELIATLGSGSGILQEEEFKKILLQSLANGG